MLSIYVIRNQSAVSTKRCTSYLMATLQHPTASRYTVGGDEMTLSFPSRTLLFNISFALLIVDVVGAANSARDADGDGDGGDTDGNMATPHGQSYNRAAVAHAVGEHRRWIPRTKCLSAYLVRRLPMSRQWAVSPVWYSFRWARSRRDISDLSWRHGGSRMVSLNVVTFEEG